MTPPAPLELAGVGGGLRLPSHRLAGEELMVLCFIIFSCLGGDSIVWASGRRGMCVCGGIVVEGGGGPRDPGSVKGT